ncbi:uncharacterized protein LOC129600574 [Paramacrobiotus metropolitanus]|uniref:uncharacterized protein LOC129600574 n=1 Tax=Paramacrobiotus metropolitanus TaxID=2943436 RepID=UPI002445B762|nr:uncharacterized protein LOC129600574 [Paramacrobiotus metropolitanus]
MQSIGCGLFVLFCIGSAPAHADSDCTSYNLTYIAPSVVSPYRFAVHLLTVKECILYFNLAANGSMCQLIPGSNLCTVNDKTPRGRVMLNTYVEIACIYKPRALVIKTTKRVSQISPQRAVVLDLLEIPGKEDLITVAVVEPIRNQTVGLTVTGCYAPNTTSRIHNLGTIPALHSIGLHGCRDLAIQKSDFDRVPQLRQVVFDLSTTDTLEPGTFTDLPHLRNLVLEKKLILALISAKNPNRTSNFSNDRYIDYVYTLHCDCSFAWLRRFFKQNRYLIEGKEPGEVFRIGSYFSEAVRKTGNGTDVFSVDCSKKVTLENIWAGNEFSYNTSCSNEMIC